MWVYRIQALDHTGAQRTLYIRAESSTTAIAHANAQGLTAQNAQQVATEDLPALGAPIEEARAIDPQSIPRAVREPLQSPLFTRPVTTIALGIFLGLSLFAVATYLVQRIILALQ